MKVKLYNTYRFENKDPAIKLLRDKFVALDTTVAQVSAKSGVSQACIRNQFWGTTRRPQHATIMAIARAMGCDFGFKKLSK